MCTSNPETFLKFVDVMVGVGIIAIALLVLEFLLMLFILALVGITHSINLLLPLVL